MSRVRIGVSILGAVALAACSFNDQVDPVSPIAVGSVSFARAAAAPSRLMVAAGGSGFSSDFASRIAALGGKVEQLHANAGFAVVSGVTAAQLMAIRGVGDVQADVAISINSPIAAARMDATALGDISAASAANPANAVLAGWQWNMAAIHADKAWAAQKLGSSGVTVAIIDSGIDYDSYDLNGLVDLKRSISLVPSDDSLADKYFKSRNRVTDFNGHGTNVASQIASNGLVFAGLTSKTTLIGVKALDRTGSGLLSGVLSGVLWAADHGANIANLSVGGGFNKYGAGQWVSIINRVFNYANKKGMLIVVAAGNETTDFDHDGNAYPTYCAATHVICVSSTGPASASGDASEFAFYSNYGRSSISVAGPGGNADIANLQLSNWAWGADIASWVWSLCSKTTIAGITAAGAPVLDVNCYKGNVLTGEIGTSQATPHVAGLAALLMAERGTGSPAAIKQAIEKSADDLGQPGTDPFYGRGRINVARALGLN